jgi:hypothetical protein
MFTWIPEPYAHPFACDPSSGVAYVDTIAGGDRMRWPHSIVCLVFLVLFACDPFACDSGALGQTANGIFVVPVPNAPFMAISTVEQRRTDPDGTSVHLKSSRAFARDSQGRLYKEIRSLEPFTDSSTAALLMTVIYDPRTRIYTYLYPRIRTYWQGTLDSPIPLLAREYFYGWPARYGLAVDKSVKQEDVGVQSVEGMAVHGVRQTETVLGRPGTVAETDEYWYSDELGMNLVAMCTQPGKSILTVRVTQVTRTEPDAAIFAIPSGYQRKEPYIAEVLP